jgi:hypothetical protein
VRLASGQLEDHLADVAELLERHGVILELGPDDDLVLEQTPSGRLFFDLRGHLPDGRHPARSVIEMREIWRPADGAFERFEYTYELIDQQRGFRRAFHLHDRDAFVRRFNVVVHEHCEQPLGRASCSHYAGVPVRDAFAAVMQLIEVWVEPSVPDCAALVCLDGPG